jgi:two-component system CheB/CheR fusion protein
VASRVLVIEDNVDAADTLRELLELNSHSVEVAYDGVAGLERARAFRPEVVLCDIGLPGMSGYEVARAIRCDESLKGIRLVAMSGYAHPEEVARSVAAGFDFHLAKPARLEVIESALILR